MRRSSKRLLAVILSLIMVMTVVMPAMAADGEATIATCEHTMTKFEGVDPTCGKSGYYPYYYCSSCELYYLTEDGEYAGFESEEEAKSEATRAPFGDHTLVEVPAVEPTCTEDGLEFHWRCSVCEAGRMYNPEIPQPIHNKTTFEKFILPTLVIPANGEHTMTKIEGVEPTCGKSGHDPYWYCSVCDLCYATEDGEYQGFTKEEVGNEIGIPPSGDHTLVEVPAVEPTCTEDGL
ncbi:MAG: hypothetical protein II350_09005, partial [Clostridia bacterium]|nr:hypothetical protein [Clostridia bacterium]